MPSVRTFQPFQNPQRKLFSPPPRRFSGYLAASPRLPMSFFPGSRSRVPIGELHDATHGLLHISMCFHPTGSHFEVPTEEFPDVPQRLHHWMCLHPTGSRLDEPTEGFPDVQNRLHYCMFFHPTGSHFDVPTEGFPDVQNRLHNCMCLHPTGSHFDVPTGESPGALHSCLLYTSPSPRDS